MLRFADQRERIVFVVGMVVMTYGFVGYVCRIKMMVFSMTTTTLFFAIPFIAAKAFGRLFPLPVPIPESQPIHHAVV